MVAGAVVWRLERWYGGLGGGLAARAVVWRLERWSGG